MAAEPGIPVLLEKLERYHFVASILLTLDVADTEGFFPFLSFIQPLTSSFNRTFGVGGQVSGSQERNMTFAYSVDMANVSRGCRPELDSASEVGLSGDLGLADIVIDGLEGLDTSQGANIYGAGGPTRPPFNATVSGLELGLKCDGSGCSSPAPSFNLSLDGRANFSPSTDPQTPGTVTFTGRAKSDNGGVGYLLSLTGSTIETAAKSDNGSSLSFTLSGSMTRDGNTKTTPDIGFNPTINLVGSVVDAKDSPAVKWRLCGRFVFPKDGKGGEPLKYLCGVTGLLTASADAEGSNKKFLIEAPINVSQPEPPRLSHLQPLFVSGAAGGAGASGAAASKGIGSSASSGTQFGSLVNFMLSYGLEGGPNWSISTFKGPAGGTGTGGQLLTASRTHTDSVTITFVAACQDDINVEQFSSYWETIPKCNGTQQILAANAGAQYNFLL